MKQSIILFGILIFVYSCSTKNNDLVGNDNDMNGCKRSAGYQWSQIKKQCIRPFEEGIKLDPVNNSNYTSYLIIQSEEVEVFLVETSGSVVLHKHKNNLWKKDIWEVEQINGKYLLKKEGNLLDKN